MKQLEAQMLLRVFEDRPGLGLRHADRHGRGAKRMQLLHLLQQNRNAGAKAFFVREDPNRQDRSEILFHNVILTWEKRFVNENASKKPAPALQRKGRTCIKHGRFL